MIASNLFWLLYLGYNQVPHYIIYGLWLSKFDISLAFTSDWHPRTYPLSSTISSRSQVTCDRRNLVQKQPHDLGLQSQHVSSVSLVPLDSLKLNSTGPVSFDSVYSRYHGLFQSSVYFNTNFSSIVASRILCSLIGLLRTSQHLTLLLCLRLVGLSQFLHFTFKFPLF